MRLLPWMMALLAVCSFAPIAVAQASINEAYVPRLGDIMTAVQLRPMKLWFAGKAGNWALAAYELRQLRAGLQEAALLYSGIPVTNVTTMANPVKAIADAIEAKDPRTFSKAVEQLTEGCNACHQSMGHNYIVMRVPDVSLFADQIFPPQVKQ